jgi:myo-inositol catabolism protein IolC
MPTMTLGYDGRLFILAFDHRGSFKKMFGVSGDPTDEEYAKLRDAKRIVFEGFQAALEQGVPKDAAGVLVDEEMGADIARAAKEQGIQLAMPVEKSGQPVFDFEYGDDFGKHIEDFDATFSKVLVRWNPGDPQEEKDEQSPRLKRLGEWLHDHDRKYLFELLVPATDGDLERVGGDKDRYDREVRPEVTIQAIEEIQAAGIEPDIWKIEGLDRQEDCGKLAATIRRDGRDGVIAVVLGRGADTDRVDHWLRMGAPVDGYNGFAIGRSIWSDEVKAHLAGDRTREEATAAIGANFKRFIDVYTQPEG